MNYKHAYHAGNFADVAKHILLVQLLNQMSTKGKPFYALDAYGGRGLYSLSSEEARKTGEAKAGVQRILDADISEAPDAVRQYVDDIKQARQTYDRHVYPGSPWWIANHVQQNPEVNVRAEAFEFKNTEYDALNYQLYQLPIGIHNRDAFEGIPAVIPPTERRGVILIDPPYEQEHKDFTRLVELLVATMTKWPQGVYALWFPIKNIEAVEDIINFIYHNIQYAEINTKPDICYKCGYTGEIQLNKEDLTWHCPSCGNSDENEMQVMRRTCGLI